MDLFARREEVLRRAYKANDEAREHGLARCEAENNYRLAKSKAALKAMELHVSATMTPTVIDGWEEVAMPRYKRNCEEVLEEAAKEEVMLRKKELAVIEDQIKREWSGAYEY
jgi:hypothetical protein